MANKAKPKLPKFSAWDEVEDCATWSTGNFLLDYVCGVPGIPRGRVVECFGPESSGKSTLFLQTAANIWNQYGIPSHWADFEDTFDPRYAKALGLTPEGLHLSPAETLEDYLEELEAFFYHGTKYALTVVDSVAAARTRSDLTDDVDARTGGMNRARIWTQNLSRMSHELAKSEMTLCLVNQLRDFIDASPGFKPPAVVAMQPKTKTPGGRGIKFYSSLRIEFTASGEVRAPSRLNPLTLEEEKTVIGKTVWLKVVKNKVAPPPWRKARLEIRDGMGFDTATNLLDFAVTHDLVSYKSGKVTFPGSLFANGEDFEVVAQDGWPGKDVAAQVLRENEPIRTTLETLARQRLADIIANTDNGFGFDSGIGTVTDEEVAEAIEVADVSDSIDDVEIGDIAPSTEPVTADV